MTVWLAVHCPHYQSSDVKKHGTSSNGKRRYRCLNSECPHSTFSLNLDYPGRKREVKQQIVQMTLNGSGVRDISRVLRVSSATVIQEFKKKLQQLESVNRRVLGQLQPEQVEVEILRVQEPEECSVEESELDEMWSDVKSKDNPRWLWHAIDHSSGQVLAYVFGARKDEVFLQL